MPVLRRFAFFSAVVAPLALALSCGKGSNNNPAAVQENGMLEIRARVVNRALAKSAAAAETTADTLVVVVSAADMNTLTIKRKLDLSRPSVGDTLTGIPPGNNRRITISTISKNGKTAHIDSAESHTVSIAKAAVASVYSVLIPAAGSIYLQFTGQSAKNRVYASFTALDSTFVAENTVKGEARTFLNLDNIPHQTTGILFAAIIDTATRDTLHVASKELTFNARADNTINLEFNPNTAMIGIDAEIFVPGVTVGSYDFSKKYESLANETGELIITEIMWSASGDNYIELYNPSGESIFLDSLTIEIDDKACYFTDVTVQPGNYFVIGRSNLLYADVYASCLSSFTSNSNWITVKRGKGGAAFDRVVFAGSNNTVGWPTMSITAKRSIELAADKYDAAENDYGKNWSAATELITEASSIQYGTPGR